MRRVSATRQRLIGAAVVLAAAVGCASFPDAESTQALGERMVKDAYPGMPSTLTSRAVQDAGQKACSRIAGEKLTADEAARV
ncbi:MAG: Sulfur oxidation c-type cytochrome SoxX, partial [Betaproteobacteria bacterium]|nr:Sulfur oxidation c-type cytochrome SoxX [Betaproteobacteria bacterium]